MMRIEKILLVLLIFNCTMIYATGTNSSVPIGKTFLTALKPLITDYVSKMVEKKLITKITGKEIQKFATKKGLLQFAKNQLNVQNFVNIANTGANQAYTHFIQPDEVSSSVKGKMEKILAQYKYALAHNTKPILTFDESLNGHSTTNNTISDYVHRNENRIIQYVEHKTNMLYNNGLVPDLSVAKILLRDNEECIDIIDYRGDLLGRIVDVFDNEMFNGLIIDVTDADNSALTNLYPMSSSQYIDGNVKYLTDKSGRPSLYMVMLDSTIVKRRRDENYISKVFSFKTKYNIEGQEIVNSYDIIMGRQIVSDCLGGESCFLNILPLTQSVQNNNIWTQVENSGLIAAKNGHKVEIKIQVKYDNDYTLFPSQLVLEQFINSKKTVSETMNN